MKNREEAKLCISAFKEKTLDKIVRIYSGKSRAILRSWSWFEAPTERKYLKAPGIWGKGEWGHEIRNYPFRPRLSSNKYIIFQSHPIIGNFNDKTFHEMTCNITMSFSIEIISFISPLILAARCTSHLTVGEKNSVQHFHPK